MLPVLEIGYKPHFLSVVRLHICVYHKVSQPFFRFLEPGMTELCQLIISKLFHLELPEHIVNLSLLVLFGREALFALRGLILLGLPILALSDGLSLWLLDVTYLLAVVVPQVLQRTLLTHARATPSRPSCIYAHSHWLLVLHSFDHRL